MMIVNTRDYNDICFDQNVYLQMKKMQISILACGWLGFPLAKSFIAQSHEVKGSTTSTEKIETLAKVGISPYLLNLDNVDSEKYQAFFATCEILIINIPPGRPRVSGRYVSYMDRILEYIPNDTKVIFISSTSVYPNTNDWVDENHPLVREGSGKEIVDAEKKLQKKLKNRLSILRFAGLIGYDRVPGRFLAHKKELSNGNSPINLIHRDDCIALIHAIIEKELWGEVLNGVADQHPLRKDFYTEAAKKIDLPAPTFTESAIEEFKIVSNKKSKEHLNFNYNFPNPYELL